MGVTVSEKFVGKLVRFDQAGVGVVDVSGVDEYIYFTPRHIDGYIGQTIDELQSPRYGNWVSGKTVIVSGELADSGNVFVESVTLKP